MNTSDAISKVLRLSPQDFKNWVAEQKSRGQSQNIQEVEDALEARLAELFYDLQLNKIKWESADLPLELDYLIILRDSPQSQLEVEWNLALADYFLNSDKNKAIEAVTRAGLALKDLNSRHNGTVTSHWASECRLHELRLQLGHGFEESLKNLDQARLTKDLSKIDARYKTREVVQETPYLIMKNTYSYLTDQDAFFIQCSEEFMMASTVGANQKCIVGFNYEASVAEQIEAHDGFMPEFSIAQINEPTIARILYKSVGNGVSPSVFFNSTEQIIFTHPTTGQKFPAFRLRIDCKRDDQHKSFQCVVSGVK